MESSVATDVTNYLLQCQSKTPCSIPYHNVANYDEAEWAKVIETSLSDEGAPSVPYINPDTLSYRDFFDKYLVKNLPCMFSPTLTSSWEARNSWITKNGDEEKLNFDKLVELYGEAPVSVQNCDDPEYKEGYGTRDCRTMTFGEYLAYFEDFGRGNQAELPKLYLKDWHIVKYHQSRQDSSLKLPYDLPVYFQSDWLNEWSSGTDQDDFKFCYMGPAGTFTGFHADVYGSYSWSANVFGVKKWFLYPPGKEMRFYDERLRKLAFRWDDPGDPGKDFVEVVQQEGECLFVPSGWHHVVWNVTDAVSLNHNWFNGTNLCFIWNSLKIELDEVQHELEDLLDIPEYHDQCQLVLKANHGIDYSGFFEMIRFMQRKRGEEEAEKLEKMSGGGGDCDFFLRFDLAAIDHLIKEHCLQDDTVKKHFLKCLDACQTGIDR